MANIRTLITDAIVAAGTSPAAHKLEHTKNILAQKTAELERLQALEKSLQAEKQKLSKGLGKLIRARKIKDINGQIRGNSGEVKTLSKEIIRSNISKTNQEKDLSDQAKAPIKRELSRLIQEARNTPPLQQKAVELQATLDQLDIFGNPNAVAKFSTEFEQLDQEVSREKSKQQPQQERSWYRGKQERGPERGQPSKHERAEQFDQGLGNKQQRAATPREQKRALIAELDKTISKEEALLNQFKDKTPGLLTELSSMEKIIERQRKIRQHIETDKPFNSDDIARTTAEFTKVRENIKTMLAENEITVAKEMIEISQELLRGDKDLLKELLIQQADPQLIDSLQGLIKQQEQLLDNLGGDSTKYPVLLESLANIRTTILEQSINAPDTLQNHPAKIYREVLQEAVDKEKDRYASMIKQAVREPAYQTLLHKIDVLVMEREKAVKDMPLSPKIPQDVKTMLDNGKKYLDLMRQGVGHSLNVVRTLENYKPNHEPKYEPER